MPRGRFGPGKATLLRTIAERGSISGAARALGMSYARAWSLTEDMNSVFGIRLVETFAGGHRRGGANLTEAGATVLVLYDRIATRATKACGNELHKLVDLSET